VKRVIPLAIAFVVSVVVGCVRPEVEPDRADLVERSLLPPTIIAGEPGAELADRMAHHGVPGVGVAVIEDAEIEWVRHYGVADASDGRPVTESTVFNIGSLSKMVTAVTILSLAEDGLVDLDAPVNDQLRSWFLPENRFTSQADVTPVRLLNHSGGVVFSPPVNYREHELPTLRQILDGTPPARTAAVRVDRVPGTGFQYSNAGFTVLRQLAEDVTSRPFEDLVAERVFEPVGMRHSFIGAPLDPVALADAAMGHRGDGSPHAEVRLWMPNIAAGGVWTTPGDFAALVVELQRALRGESDRVLSRESVELMVRPHDAPRYGLGVFQRGGGDRARYVSHLGDGPGFVAAFVMDVVGGRGFVVLTNGRGGISLVREIGRAVEKVEQWPHILPEALVPTRLDETRLEALAGRYRMGYDEVAIDLREGSLWLESIDLGPVKLFAVGDQTLVCRERAGELTYETDASGAVVRLDFRLADELGRPAGAPTPLEPMKPGERSPMGLLLDGDLAEATEVFLHLQQTDRESPVVSEQRLNSLGYRLLGRARLDDAVRVFRVNAALHPDSGNVHDSLGEGLMMTGRIEEAIASYRKSLELDPSNGNARTKIASMVGET
jgi:CubicO group peptidase (beta-lactamase class C family)